MIVSLAWFAVLVITSIAVIGAAELASEQNLPWKRRNIRGRFVIAAIAAVALVTIALLWRVHSIASGDAKIIRELSKSRGKSFTSVMQIVTTMGDAMPSMLIASVVALIIYRHQKQKLAVLLPLAVLAEILVQIVMTKSFHDITIHQIDPSLVLGGTGTIPSGSVARLLSVFLLASHLWRPSDGRASRRIATTGTVLVVIQATSRLFLGRHLCADIAGGILLGICLERIGYLIICWARAEPGEPDTLVTDAGEDLVA